MAIREMSVQVKRESLLKSRVDCVEGAQVRQDIVVRNGTNYSLSIKNRMCCIDN